MKLQNGFTLIELMVTIVIVSILASIAVPAYTDYVIRGRIPEATNALASQRVRLEQYFQDNRSYIGFDCIQSFSNFDIDCDAGQTATTYTLTASGTNSMSGFTYTINQDGDMSSEVVSPAPSGWRQGATPCWITKKGEMC